MLYCAYFLGNHEISYKLRGCYKNFLTVMNRLIHRFGGLFYCSMN